MNATRASLQTMALGFLLTGVFSGLYFTILVHKIRFGLD